MVLPSASVYTVSVSAAPPAEPFEPPLEENSLESLEPWASSAESELLEFEPPFEEPPLLFELEEPRFEEEPEELEELSEPPSPTTVNSGLRLLYASVPKYLPSLSCFSPVARKRRV